VEETDDCGVLSIAFDHRKEIVSLDVTPLYHSDGLFGAARLQFSSRSRDEGHTEDTLKRLEGTGVAARPFLGPLHSASSGEGVSSR